MAKPNADRGLWLIIVGLAAWIIPGAGHFLIHERKRAIIIFVTVTALFLTGLYIGSIGVVNSQTSKPWFMAQILYSPAVGILSEKVSAGYIDAADQHQEYQTFGHPADIGQLYTGVAGLLNLLCILSAVYMAYCGRGEIIGTEEESDHG